MMQTNVLGHRASLPTFVKHVIILRVLIKRKVKFHPTKINSKAYYKGRKSTFHETVSTLYMLYCLLAMQTIPSSTLERKIKLRTVISSDLDIIECFFQTAPFWLPQVNMQFLQFVLLLLACQKCSGHTKVLYVGGCQWFSSAAGKYQHGQVL